MPGLLSLAHLSPPSRWPLRFVIFLRSFKVADTLRRDGPITITASIRGRRDGVLGRRTYTTGRALCVWSQREFLSAWGVCVLPGLPIHEQLVFTMQPEPYDGASIKESAGNLNLHVAQWAPAVSFDLIFEGQKMIRPLGGFYQTKEESLVTLISCLRDEKVSRAKPPGLPLQLGHCFFLRCEWFITYVEHFLGLISV